MDPASKGSGESETRTCTDALRYSEGLLECVALGVAEGDLSMTKEVAVPPANCLPKVEVTSLRAVGPPQQLTADQRLLSFPEGSSQGRLG